MTHQDDVIRCIIMWEPTVSATIRSANKSVHPLKTVITTTHPTGLRLSAYSVHPLETVIATKHPVGLHMSAHSVHSRNSYNDQASSSTSSVSVQCPPSRNRGDDHVSSWTASSAYSSMYRMTSESSDGGRCSANSNNRTKPQHWHKEQNHNIRTKNKTTLTQRTKPQH